jgi:hypothetical protein
MVLREGGAYGTRAPASAAYHQRDITPRALALVGIDSTECAGLLRTPIAAASYH